MGIVRAKTISGIKWAYLSNFLVYGIQPLTLAILARLLTPEDLGLMAMASTVTGFIRLFKDLGLGQALIQHRGRTEEVADTAFWLQLLFGTIWFISVWIAAPLIASYYHREEVIPILRTLGVLFLIYPFSDVPLSILVRDLEFKALFFRQAAPLLFSSLVSIALAYAGFGAWALVFGSIVGAGATAIVVLWISEWYPGFRFKGQILAKLLNFGMHVSIQNILGWLIVSVDQVFVGRFLGAHDLGIYRMGFTLGDMPWSLISGPFNLVLYSVLCKASSDLYVVRKQYLAAMRWLTLINVPVGIAVASLAPSIVPLFLGPKWTGVIPILQLIALVGTLASVVTMNPEVYKAIGRPDIMSKFLLVRAIVSLPLYYFAAQKGIVVLAAMHLGLTLVFAPINTAICMHVLHINVKELFLQIREGMAIGGVLITIGMLYRLVVAKFVVPEPINGVGLLGIFLLIGGVTLWYFDRGVIQQLASIVKPGNKMEG
jgi:O-antigen/teichoic acid export membrane protein